MLCSTQKKALLFIQVFLLNFKCCYKMKWMEGIILKLRSNKYAKTDDIVGVNFIKQSIKKGQTAIDIGAHKGGYLYLMLQLVGDSGQIVAFEPQSILFKYLMRMKTMFNWQNVTIEHLALSDEEGEAKLLIPTNNISKASAPGATIVDNRERNDIGFSEQVATNSLDNYCEKYSIKPDFLKIDVEGNELPIFKGGINTLRKYKPKIYVECDAGYVGKEQVLETFSFLMDLGYTASFINNLERLPINQFDFEVHQNRVNGAFLCVNFIFE